MVKAGTVSGVSESNVKFNKRRLVRPYIYSMICSLLLFIFFTGAFLIAALSGVSNLRKISNFYKMSSGMSNTLVNNIIFTKILILSNSTDEGLMSEVEGNNDIYSIEKGFVSSNFDKISNLLFEHLKMVDYGVFKSVRSEFYDKLNCDYLYSTIKEDLYTAVTNINPELKDIPAKMCNAMRYTNNTRNLFFNILEEVNYSNKRLLNSVQNSGQDYAKLKAVFDAEAFWDLSAYVIFVVRPVQSYLKDTVVFTEHLTAAASLHRTVVLFLLLYIFLEIMIFYLINSKFSQTILETNEKFSEFLNCIQ
jgi:hypothetical protein